jgi:hypothetical protein
MPTETFSQTKEGSTWLTKEEEEDIEGELLTLLTLSPLYPNLDARAIR